MHGLCRERERALMPDYYVVVTDETIRRYRITADNPEAAREIALSPDFETHTPPWSSKLLYSSFDAEVEQEIDA